MPETFHTNAVGTIRAPCPQTPNPAPPSPTYWVEIQLTGDDGSAVPFEEYQVTLPNGDLVKGFVDENGLARIDRITVDGKCTITFPKLDQDAWEPLT